MPRVTVTVRAADPLSELGVVTALRPRPEIRLVPAVGAETAAVGVVVTHAVDAPTLRGLAALRAAGVSRAVLVAGAVGDRDLAAAVDAGAVGVVRRAEATPDRLVHAVLQSAAAEARPAAELLARLTSQAGRVHAVPVRPAARAPRLAPREVEVLRLVADGFDTAQIAHQLCWSERTVKNVLHGVTTRLNLRNRSHAVAVAVREGLI